MSQIAKEEKEPCKICKRKTAQGFNIGFKLTPICEFCERAIVIQSVQYKYDNR